MTSFIIVHCIFVNSCQYLNLKKNYYASVRIPEEVKFVLRHLRAGDSFIHTALNNINLCSYE